MPSASGIRAGLAYVELYADNNPLTRGLNAASAKLKAFGQSVSGLGLKLAGIGAGVVTPILAITKGFADFGSQLNDMSVRTGVSVEALSEIGYAAQLSGSSLEDVEGALRKMQRTVVAAAAGSDTAAEALATLGLNAAQLAVLSPEDQFTEIAKRLNDIPDPSQKAAAAMAVFGRSGAQLLPLIGDMDALREEARRLGITMSSEDVAAADALGDSFDRIKAVLRTVATTIGSAVAPLLMEWTGWLTDIIVATRKWLTENKGLIVSALKIGAVIVGIAAALIAAGTVISAIGSVFGALSTIITTGVAVITGAIGLVVTTISTIGAAFSTAAAVIAGAVGFILTPIGALAVGIIALAGYFLYASGVSRKVIEYLGDRFTDLKDAALEVFAEIRDFALESFQGIKDALAAGDVALAARILWLSLQVAWKKGIAILTKYWTDFTSSIDRVFADAFYGLLLIATDVFYDLRETWAVTTRFFGDMLDNFIGFFYKVWNEAVGWLAKKIAYLASFFDDSFDLDVINKGIDDETARLSRRRDDENAGAAEARTRALGDIERERMATIGEINREANNVDAAREQNNLETIGKAEDELNHARQEWVDALAQAKSERESAQQPTVEKAKESLRGALPEIQTAQSKLDVLGTFNATAAAALGFGNTAADRTAKASEETARNTKRIIQKMDEDGLAFE